jgi:DNA-binding HxlR family transcriptional regulator
MFRTRAQHTSCATCPIARTADLLGDSTTLLIIRDLSNRTCRFRDLSESLPRVSSRTLTNKLKFLEKKELITRRTYPGFPPKVMYELTKKGKGIVPIIAEMDTYGRRFLREQE